MHRRAGRYANHLRACTVELLGRREARGFILKREALKTAGNACLWFGLREPGGRLLSVIGFGVGPHAAGAVTLERGATRRRAPRNSASFLIAAALRYGRRHLNWRVIKAFSDPRFGERGLVYKAVGFKACPPSKHGTPWRYALVEADGRIFSDRAIFRKYGSHARARAVGAQIVKLPPRQAWQWGIGR
jgi:hypothetical protein